MDHIDVTQVYMLIEARNKLAREAFNLDGNRGILAPAKQTRQPTKVAPSGTASTITLQLRLDKKPVNPDTGHVFGSSEGDCDVLLDTSSSRGVSPKAFGVELEPTNGLIILTCHATNGVFFWKDTKDAKPKHLKRGDQFYVRGGRTWIIVVGNVQIALIPIVRDNDSNSLFHKNLNACKGGLVKEVPKPSIEWLRIQASDQNPPPITPAPRDLTGIWGKYTTAGTVRKGGMDNITACISQTDDSTYCIKKAKAAEYKGKLRKEIIILRKMAHPSIVQYIDRDEKFKWVAIELAKEGNLDDQHAIKPFSMRETEVLVYQVLDALSHIHSCGIVHQNIKTSNILVQTRTKAQILVKIADFGEAAMDREHPYERQCIGTPMYLAPECFEQLPESWGIQIDVWALAVVALELMFGLPGHPESADFKITSFFAGGWRGLLEKHLHKNAEEYLDDNSEASHQFFETLSEMFNLNPKARISALNACQSLRGGYPKDHFLSLGIGNGIPVIAQPVLPADASDDDSSIFRFRELPVQGSSKPLVILEGCYLVNMSYVMEARSQGSGGDLEIQTYEEMERYGGKCWRFKITNRFPERYIEIELALKICVGLSHRQHLLDVLNTQQTLRDQAKFKLAAGKGKKAMKFDQLWPGIPQLDLIESISDSESIIAITEEGRMILVRASDGYLHVPSLEAVLAKQLLTTKDALNDKAPYIPLEQAMCAPGLLSHNDIVSLGAATYCSY